MSFQLLLRPPVNHIHMVGLKSTRPDESQKQRLAHGLSSRERFFVPPKLLCGKGFFLPAKQMIGGTELGLGQCLTIGDAMLLFHCI